MTEIARRAVLQRKAVRTAVAAIATVLTAALLWTPSAMAVSIVNITTKFENSPISLNTSDAIGYAITNNTGLAQTVNFTDSLPAGVTLDNPVGTTNTTGTGTCTLVSTTASPGATSVSVSVTVPSETGSGAVCTISFNIVPNSPSSADAPLADSYSGASATTVTPSTTPSHLIVLTNPTLSFTAPAANQVFTLGQVFDASFGCTQTDQLDSISAFFGTDDEGNQIQSGAPIDTLDPGSHTLEVDCYSGAGGGQVSQTVTYKVGSYRLTAVKKAKETDYVSFKTLVPAGTLVAKLLYGTKKTVIGTKTVTVANRGRARVTIRPTSAGKKLLTSVSGRTAPATLQVSFSPKTIGSGDSQVSAAASTVLTKSIRLPIARASRVAR